MFPGEWRVRRMFWRFFEGGGGGGESFVSILSYNRPVVSRAFSRYQYGLEENTITPV